MKTRALLLACSLLATSLASAQPASSLVNLSSRGLVGSTAGSLVAGFVIDGPVAKSVLIRGVGPGLAEFGVPNPASAVRINVFDSLGNFVATNRGFHTAANVDAVVEKAAQVGAFPLSARGDSAVLVSLPPDAYTIEIAPETDNVTDGSALLEVYDGDPAGSSSRIANLSTRGRVGATAGALISGFVITGTVSKNLLIRGVGPDLAAFGITNAAAAVDINIYNADGDLVASNSGYLNDPHVLTTVQTASHVGAFPLSDPGDSAVVATLAPGAYTVSVSPTNPDSADGIGLVEVYDADSRDSDSN